MVSGKYVLDFGGGTGNDLQWLIQSGFKVYFCEPSKGMREIAMNNFQKSIWTNEIIFLDDEGSVFQKWENNNIPFEYQVDGILANFAVLNSIKQLEQLSEKLALVSKQNTRLIISVLDFKLKKIYSRDIFKIARLYFSGHGLVTKVKDNDCQMVVYLHTKTKLIKSFKKYFNFDESFLLADGTFRLFHFLRNDTKVA
jgi:SAM-dependent methyltransferase